MSDETRITLPDAETMMSRLQEVSYNPHVVQYFYPLLTKYAGKERVPMGIVMMLQLAIHDYAKNLPMMMVSVLNMDMDNYIDALVLDEDAAAEAKTFWTAVQEKAKAG